MLKWPTIHHGRYRVTFVLRQTWPLSLMEEKREENATKFPMTSNSKEFSTERRLLQFRDGKKSSTKNLAGTLCMVFYIFYVLAQLLKHTECGCDVTHTHLIDGVIRYGPWGVRAVGKSGILVTETVTPWRFHLWYVDMEVVYSHRKPLVIRWRCITSCSLRWLVQKIWKSNKSCETLCFSAAKAGNEILSKIWLLL